LPFGQAALKFYLPQESLLSLHFFNLAGRHPVWGFVHWASENEKMPSRKVYFFQTTGQHLSLFLGGPDYNISAFQGFQIEIK